ncbi:MAG: hypothetical protein ABR540_19175 [Acidimicrobiales bacterium]|nr:hypothetical protein [Actinomycetota bacterium]
MDLSKLSPAEKIIAGSGLALAVVAFFPWFGINLIIDINADAWDNVWSSLAVLVGIIMAALVLISRFSKGELPTLPVTWGQVYLILGALALALVVLQMALGDELRAGADSIELERKFGSFLGLVAAAGLAYGGFLRSKEPESAQGFRP